MGCDYYTYYVLCIQYKKNGEIITDKEILEDTRERHYFHYDLKRDEDFEEEDEYMKRCQVYEDSQIEYTLAEYKSKEILKDGKWLCVQSAQEKYTEMCKELKINLEDIQSIWKEGGYHYR